MPSLYWQTPDDSESWCDVSFVLPAPLLPSLLQTVVLMGLPELWAQEGDVTPEEAAQYFDDVFHELSQDCEVFLFDEEGYLLTDEEGFDLY